MLQSLVAKALSYRLLVVALALAVAGANTHDIKLVADTLDALQAGRPGRRLRLCMDKGYEAG